MEITFDEGAQVMESDLAAYALEVQQTIEANNFMIGPFQTPGVFLGFSEPFGVNSVNTFFSK